MNLSNEAIKGIAVWALSDNTGVSSSTIASVALGIKEDKNSWRISFDCPHDASDFGRCIRLLNLVPELREYLPAVVEACPQWAPLVAIWDELEALGPTPMLDGRIRELRDTCLEAGGYRKVGKGTWVKVKPLPDAPK